MLPETSQSFVQISTLINFVLRIYRSTVDVPQITFSILTIDDQHAGLFFRFLTPNSEAILALTQANLRPNSAFFFA